MGEFGEGSSGRRRFAKDYLNASEEGQTASDRGLHFVKTLLSVAREREDENSPRKVERRTLFRRVGAQLRGRQQRVCQRGNLNLSSHCRHRHSWLRHQEHHQRHTAVPVHDWTLPSRLEEHVITFSLPKKKKKKK